MSDPNVMERAHARGDALPRERPLRSRAERHDGGDDSAAAPCAQEGQRAWIWRARTRKIYTATRAPWIRQCLQVTKNIQTGRTRDIQCRTSGGRAVRIGLNRPWKA